jgi:hypothetical protein
VRPESVFFNKRLIVFSFLFLVYVSILEFIYSGSSESKSIFAHIFFFSFFYPLVLPISIYSIDFSKKMLKNSILAIYWILVATCVLDFVLMLQGINYYLYIPSFIPVEAGIIGLPRARGAFPEPTDLGAAITIFYFISRGFVRIDGKSSFGLVLAWVVCFFMHRSSMAIISFTLGNLIIFFYGRKSFKFINLIYIILFFLLLFIIFNQFDKYFDNSVSSSIFNKIFLTDENVGSGRVEIYSDVLKIINSEYSLIDILFGRSLGSFSDEYVINYYLQVFLEIGVLGICFVLVFISNVFFDIRKISSNLRPFFYASGLTILVQLFSNTGFYFPHYWVFVLAVYLIQKSNISK